MVTYLWIALGGALGSASRAWVAVTMLKIIGPQFPWGTVLINIVGSFIIGFFGTLTASDGRFGAPSDIRAFVMVGICGGFTTFSSFSLQTLDLLRDGRPGQALGNIALSVALCLLSVAAGHYGAAAVNGSSIRIHAMGKKSMGDVIVTLLDKPESASGLLAAAGRLLEIRGGGRIEVVAVRTPPLSTIMPTEEVLTADREAEIRAEQENWAGQLKAVLESWLPRAQAPGIQAEWVDVEGDAAKIVAEYGRRSEMVVVASRVPHEGERARLALHAAVFDTGHPVLIVPPGVPSTFGRVVAIAWKDDERAPKAVLSSLPYLKQAEQLHLLRTAEADNASGELPDLFREHGLDVQLQVVPAHDGPAGERLLAAAHQVGADLLVMGAYAHGEWREAIFGGVTRYMLSHADLALFIQH